nr:hypothetical protein [Tanacetum cinerariifolium]
MIVDSIENGPYVRRMIATLGEPNLPVPVPESFHEQTDEELTENDIKRIDADDQAIQTILLGLPEDVYAAEKKAKLVNEWEKFTSTDGELIKSYYHRFMQFMNDAQKEEAGIQLQAEEFDFMAAAGDLDEIEEVNANCILMANLQHASTSGTQLDKASVYDTDGSAESSSAHKEVHKIISYEIAPIINQVDARVQNFEIQFLQEAAKFVRDFNLAKEADESLDKQKSLELEMEQLLKASVSHDIMSIVQNGFVDVQSDLQTELDRTKEKLEHCIIKKEKEYVVLWNNWYTRCEEYKYDKISSNKAYNDMQQKVERLQAQLRDLKGLVHIARTRRPQPKGNTRNARVPSASKISEVKKKVTVEDHRKILLLSKNQKTMSSEYNNIKLAIRNDKSEIVFSTCKKCLVTANHDACLLSSVNALNSRATNLCANAPSANQKRHRTQVWKPKQVGFKERFACTPKTRLPRFSLKWSPSGRSFDLKENFVASKEANCPNDDKACPYNPQEPIRKRFPNSTVFLGRLSKFKFLGTVRFGNDRIAVILGYGDLKWRNITITRVYFVEGGTLASLEIWMVLACSKAIVLQISTPSISMTWPRLLPYVSWPGKSKRASRPPKPVLNSKQRLHLLHMDLCGPMRVASINGKRYVLVIVDDYSRYTWVPFLRTKDETPEVIKNFLKKIYVRLQTPVIIVRTDNETEFKNHALKEYFDSVAITHETSAAKTPQQNGVEYFDSVAITHETSAAKNPQQNGVVERINCTLVEAARTMLIFSHAPLFLWAENDREDIGKLGAKGDIGFFIGYSANSVAYRVYNRRTKKIMETMNVTFDELSAMAFEQNSLKPEAPRTVPAAPQGNHTPLPTASAADSVPNAVFEGDLFFNHFATPSTESVVSSTQYVDPSNMHTFYQPYPHDYQCTKDHPLEQVIGEPSRPILTRNQLKANGNMCIYALTVNIIELKTIKEALTDPAWIESIQEELHQFIRLDVCELVPSPDGIKPLTLKWLFKNKHDEENTVIRNKTRLVVRGYR